jgi:hypothetical protein
LENSLNSKNIFKVFTCIFVVFNFVVPHWIILQGNALPFFFLQLISIPIIWACVRFFKPELSTEFFFYIGRQFKERKELYIPCLIFILAQLPMLNLNLLLPDDEHHHFMTTFTFTHHLLAGPGRAMVLIALLLLIGLLLKTKTRNLVLNFTQTIWNKAYFPIIVIGSILISVGAYFIATKLNKIPTSIFDHPILAYLPSLLGFSIAGPHIFAARFCNLIASLIGLFILASTQTQHSRKHGMLYMCLLLICEPLFTFAALGFFEPVSSAANLIILSAWFFELKGPRPNIINILPWILIGYFTNRLCILLAIPVGIHWFLASKETTKDKFRDVAFCFFICLAICLPYYHVTKVAFGHTFQFTSQKYLSNGVLNYLAELMAYPFYDLMKFFPILSILLLIAGLAKTVKLKQYYLPLILIGIAYLYVFLFSFYFADIYIRFALPAIFAVWIIAAQSAFWISNPKPVLSLSLLIISLAFYCVDIDTKNIISKKDSFMGARSYSNYHSLSFPWHELQKYFEKNTPKPIYLDKDNRFKVPAIYYYNTPWKSEVFKANNTKSSQIFCEDPHGIHISFNVSDKNKKIWPLTRIRPKSLKLTDKSLQLERAGNSIYITPCSEFR